MSKVEEYREYARHSECGHNYATMSGLREHADAAIVVLEHRVEVEHDRAEDLLLDSNHATKKCEQAEAERDALRLVNESQSEQITGLKGDAGWLRGELEQTTAKMEFQARRAELAEKARAATIEVLNDCQAEMGRQCARAEKAEAALAEREMNIREVTALIQPGGYNERLATRVLTDPVVHAFGFVADQERKRADKAEWQLGEAFQDIRKTRVERHRLSSLRTLNQYVADLDRRWEEHDG